MKVHVFYPGNTEDTTQEIVLTKHVFVITPPALIAAIALTALALAYVTYRLRRRLRRKLLRMEQRVPAGA